MGLLNKIKGILFEEVEEDEVVNTPKAEEKKPIAEKIEPQKKVEEVETPKVNVVKPKVEVEQLNERELFKSDNTSPFFDFDEEEFSNMSRVQKPKPSTNVLEYERKKKMEKRYDMGSFTKVERTEVVEKKKFKPSPIISPVYGILNEDYRPEDIKNKSEVSTNNTLDFNSVRKKAFGEEVKEEPKTTYYEETVTVKLKENDEEKKQKVKTIDELLEKQQQQARKWDVLLDEKEVKPVSVVAGTKPNYWVYGVLAENKRAFMEEWRLKGYYVSGVHLPNTYYSVFGKQPELRGVLEFYSKYVALPCGWWLE